MLVRRVVVVVYGVGRNCDVACEEEREKLGHLYWRALSLASGLFTVTWGPIVCDFGHTCFIPLSSGSSHGQEWSVTAH